MKISCSLLVYFQIEKDIKMAEIDENENISKNTGKQLNKSGIECFQDSIGVSFLTCK